MERQKMVISDSNCCKSDVLNLAIELLECLIREIADGDDYAKKYSAIIEIIDENE